MFKHSLKNEWLENKYGWLAAAFSFVLRLLYTFVGTKYRSYVINDMRWYYERALEFSRGDFTSPSQWEFWPPFYHMILGSVIKLADIFRFSAVRFEVILILQMLLGAASVYAVFRVAKNILSDRCWAGLVSGLYALVYPVILYSGLILSENIAIPMVIFSVWLIIEPSAAHSKRSFLLSGLFLAFASVVRPAASLYVLPFLWFVWVRGGKTGLNSAWKFFLSGYLILTVLSGVYTYVISGGKVSGISTNGGVNLFLRQCRVKMLNVKVNGVDMVYSPVQFYNERYDGLFRLETHVAPYEQSFYTRTSWDCLKRGGWHLLLADLVESVKLVWGYAFFPWFGDAFMIIIFLNIWIWWFLAVFIFGIAGSFSKKMLSGQSADFIKFVLGLVGCVFLTAVIFPVEQRFMYPLIFLIYILAALVLRQKILDKKRKNADK